MTIEPDNSITYIPELIIALDEPALKGLISLNDTIGYQVCYYNAPETCLQASVFITMNFVTAIKDLGYNDLTLYPNPVIDELRVKSEKPVSMLEILDFTGKIIMKAEPGKSDFTIRMAGLKGIYFVRITIASGETLMKKVIKL